MNNLENKKIMAKNIQKYLDQSNMSRAELAQNLGASYSAVSEWLQGRTYPRIDKIEIMAKIFDIPKSLLIEGEHSANYDLENTYKMFPVSVSAGSLENVEGITEYDDVSISDTIMGKYAGNKDIILLKVNGESMNKLIPNDSIIVIDTSKNDIISIKDKDIVVFSQNGEYSVKRFINDKCNHRFIFAPESTDVSFIPIVFNYDNSVNLKLIGKVVKYIVDLD